MVLHSFGNYFLCNIYSHILAIKLKKMVVCLSWYIHIIGRVMHLSQQSPPWPKPGGKVFRLFFFLSVAANLISVRKTSVCSHVFFSLNWTSSWMLFTLGKGLICPETIFCLFLWRMEGLRVQLHVASLSSLRGLQQGCWSNMRENATLKECVCHLVRCLEILSGTSASVVALFSLGFYCLKKESVCFLSVILDFFKTL